MLKENNRRLTSVFFIGSQKCGTSTLFEWLKQDKRLLFPTNKETHYFSTNFDFGLKWYNHQFKPNETFRLRCEIDTTTDGTNFSQAALGSGNTHGTGGAAESYARVQFIFDVTDVSTHKVRFNVDPLDASNTTTKGSSVSTLTGFTFIRLGDT